MCGCLASLLRLLGAGIWDYSSRQPSEVLEAFERQIRHEGDHTVPFCGVWAGGRTPRPPNEAIHKKVLEMLPLLVSSGSVGGRLPSSPRISGRVDADVPCGNRESAVEGQGETGLTAGGGSDDGATPGYSFSLADAALELLSRDLAALSTRGSDSSSASDSTQGGNRRRKMALARALLDVVETCYNDASSAGGGGGASGNGSGNVGGNHDGDPLRPENWPWNAAASETASDAANSDWWHPSWPVRSLPLWGPRLADIAGDRSSRGSGATGEGASTGAGGGGALVVDRAAKLVEFVLRQHSGAAWRIALGALRPPISGSGSAPQERGGRERKEEGEGEKEKGQVLPLCGALLERICLELPLMDLPVRVHAAVFEAHGWLSLLPCGDYFIFLAYHVLAILIWRWVVHIRCSTFARD